MFVHKLVICFYVPHHCRGKHDYFTVTAHQISYACSQLPRMESRIQQTHSISFKINTLFTGMMRLLVIESNFSVMESVYRNLCISFCYFCIFFFFFSGRIWKVNSIITFVPFPPWHNFQYLILLEIICLHECIRIHTTCGMGQCPKPCSREADIKLLFYK